MSPPAADHSTDLLIVGAGPTGLFAAYYAGFRGLSVTVLDSLPEPGGQINAMYPEKQIFDIAGFPAVRGRELVDRLLEQAAPYDPYYLLGHRAETLERTAERGFAVSTHQGVRVRARAVLLTGGIGTFTPRPLTAAAYEGAGLAYFVRRPEEYAGQEVVIVGGGDSAFDWALTLHPLAASVTLVHRRDAFRAHPATVAAVQALGVEIITEAELTAVVGDGQGLEAVEITQRDGRTHRLSCRRIIAALGFTANLGPLLGWGIDIANRRHIPVDSAMRTSVPGIYAAGDINDYPGKVRLIAVGFGEAATAVNNAAHHIDPEQPVFPGHSTDVPTAAATAA
ncbi:MULTISPECIES: NAD(P)/FAD-dependent oxidoreductase [unclassified Streptomyces]|uniref:NAD(P)/FAD-dependent oxidoreductase n=1 Tax=unclassified Streptomyces TaxID=2593676 RepID=UPI00236572A3|nr:MULTISPECIES: NAD(P)/FAD-dependent oxidoreductase [unclassified Streptomyces]MDF3144112.1 NAD(P)/FAD-dependent oxidoreductase [Streptomyces sp. T21Q-yed]WDF35777.1 NAD(P)/FAD-dependent oxidoreductase [Streptomyces sp. T12]